MHNHRFARSREKKTVTARNVLSKLPLFDESGENVEDKRKREKEEAARIAAAAKKAEEEEKLRKATCESLIRNAKELKEAGKYKNALSQLAQSTRSGSGRSFEPNTRPGKRNQEFERSQQSDQTADRLV